MMEGDQALIKTEAEDFRFEEVLPASVPASQLHTSAATSLLDLREGIHTETPHREVAATMPPETADPAFDALPGNWTLRFKLSAVTILLHVEPQTPFTRIKAALLAALRGAASPPKLPARYLPLPDDPDAVELGVARDRFDIAKGFVPLEVPEEGDKKAKRGVLNDSPLGAGLRDGAALAFRWRSAAAGGMEGEEEEAEWDVVVPGLGEEDEPVDGA